jgi:adenine phosphoribosyltransferase
MDELKEIIRNVPDFPKKGILFYDITTLLKNGPAFSKVIDELVRRYQEKKIDLVLGIESRGFIFAAALADRLGAGFIPIRKPGKLPAETLQATYDLEYGKDSLEIHRDAIQPGQQVLLVDDLLATGGTAAAALQLVRQLEGIVVGVAFIIELEFLQGRKKLEGCEITSLLQYQD